MSTFTFDTQVHLADNTFTSVRFLTQILLVLKYFSIVVLLLLLK